MRLVNVIKFVALSATLSDTCLFAGLTCQIKVGFGYNSDRNVISLVFEGLCCGSEVEESWPNPEGSRVGRYSCVVNPVDEEGKMVNWVGFGGSSASDRKPAPKVPWDEANHERQLVPAYYTCHHNAPGPDWMNGDVLHTHNDIGGFRFCCGRFSIRLDKEGVLHLSGGGKCDILELIWVGAERAGLPVLPLVFDGKEVFVREKISCKDTKKGVNFSLFVFDGKEAPVKEEIFFEDEKVSDGLKAFLEAKKEDRLGAFLAGIRKEAIEKGRKVKEGFSECKNVSDKDVKTSLEGDLFIVRGFKTFTNEGTMKFKDITFENITSFKNKGTIDTGSFNFFNSYLENEKEIKVDGKLFGLGTVK